MPARRILTLTPEQRADLERTLTHDSRPYLRERCAALLKIADGASARQVALHGLYHRRRVQTVLRWLDRYLADGLPGLVQRPRRPRGYPP
jgi:hypothetical protein